VIRSGVMGTLLLAAGLWSAGGGNGSAEQGILTIRPYRWQGDWVIDDARVGLAQAPCAAAGGLLDAAIAAKGLGHADDGFLLWFSAHPFPGYDVHLHTIGVGDSGPVFTWTEAGRTGHLCAALLHYFPTAPQDLYVRLGD